MGPSLDTSTDMARRYSKNSKCPELLDTQTISVNTLKLKQSGYFI